MTKAEAVEYVGKIRQAVGLPCPDISPPSFVVREMRGEGVSGSYRSYDNRISLRAGYTIDTLFHEICHAYQRDYLRTEEKLQYMASTPYEERWYEVEAFKIAKNACICMAGANTLPPTPEGLGMAGSLTTTHIPRCVRRQLRQQGMCLAAYRRNLRRLMYGGEEDE